MEAIAPLLTVYLGIAGLMLGSFINMAADRLPRGESIISPGSHCRSCDRRLNFVDLLPLAGYAIRGGRCATCRTAIGASAPLVEALSGGLVLAPIAVFGLWPGAGAGLLLVAAFGATVIGRELRRARGSSVS